MNVRISRVAALAAVLLCVLCAHPGGLDAEESRTVVIRYQNSVAGAVSIVGTFNHWRMGMSPLKKSDTGLWTVTLSLPPGVYRYMLAPDGKDWIPDPHAPRAPDGFGSYNSILTVE